MSDEVQLRVPITKEVVLILIAILVGIVVAILIGMALGATQAGSASTDDGKVVEIEIR
jgi:hypothetical protein